MESLALVSTLEALIHILLLQPYADKCVWVSVGEVLKISIESSSLEWILNLPVSFILVTKNYLYIYINLSLIS